MGITLRIVTGSVLTYGQVDTNFSSLYYSASQSGNNLVLHTTGSLVQAATATTFNLGLGNNTVATGDYSHAEGLGTIASGDYSHAEGVYTVASGDYSHAEGANTVASGDYSHAEGDYAKSIGSWSHAEGSYTSASGNYSHAEGNATIASEAYSHAEGHITLASGISSHAEGYNTTASAFGAHAEGGATLASGIHSHVEGVGTTASGYAAHAEGRLTVATGSYSHAEGLSTIALADFQHVQGQYNITSPFQSAFILGNGTSDGSRSNLIFASGSEVQISGSLTVGSGSSTVAPTYGFTPSLAIGLPTGSTGAVINLSNTRGIIVGGDTLGILQFSGLASGTSYASSQIRATVNSSAGSGNAGGGILSFWTGLANSGAFPEERMRINHQGNVGIGTSAPTAKLDVNGNVIITGSLNVSSNANIRQNIYTGVTPPGGTSGGYFNIYNSLSPAYSEFGFYSTDNADSDGFGSVRITANPEEGIVLYGSTYSSTEVSAITVKRGFISMSTPLLGITSPLVQITGSLSNGNAVRAQGSYSHAEGVGTVALKTGSHAEGYYSHALNLYSHAEGTQTFAGGIAAHSEGSSTVAGYRTNLVDDFTDTEGQITLSGNLTTYFTQNTPIVVLGDDFDYSGTFNLTSIVYNSGPNTTTFEVNEYQEQYVGFLISTTYGYYSHAEGERTVASGFGSHAEGYDTRALGSYSHAEGDSTIATGDYSHAEGLGTIASGDYSHAEGVYTVASGDYSHAEGLYTVATGNYQHVQGQYNISSSARSAFIIGNGTADGSRSNLVFASGSSVQITGSLMLNDILVLAPRTTTPTPSTGMVIVSGSGVDQHIYCYLNSTWKQLD